MKFILPGPNIKILGKAIHCLAKIGDEVFLEPESTQLTIMTVNLSRSAFATFCFGSTFFSYVGDSQKTNADQDKRCKVMMRSLLLAFKSLHSLEKTVDSCTLEFCDSDCKLNITFNCRHSISKKFSLGLLECENLKPVYDINQCHNLWKIDSKVMQEAYANFLSNQEEVTMFVTNGNVKIKNYNDDIDEKKQIHTSLTMMPAEFEAYQINLETSITFCLKEFRSLLIIAEYLGVPILANFSEGGSPLILSVNQGEFVSSTYILATLAEDGTSQPAIRSPPPRTNINASLSNFNESKSNGALHSTQKDFNTQNSAPTIYTPDISNIPPPISSIPDVPINDEDCFTASPPSKKKKVLFRRCFDATWNPSKVLGTEKVLAPDSDEET